MFGADLPYNMYIHDDEPKTDQGWNFDLEEYLTPHNQVPHPWSRSTTGDSHLEQDFILVAEFSELEGPREVLTIPKDGSSNFNITDFSVRIMSLDHQTTTKQGFHLVEDSQVTFSEIKDSIFAFVHHFALYDRHARGYVRPFAISFITPDSSKLLQFYEEISQQMKKVVRYLKYGNKLVFKNSLEMHLMDLHYTKAEMLLRMRSRKSAHPISEEDVFYKNLKTLEANITETQNVLHTIRQSLVDKKLEHRFARLEEKAKIEIPRPKSDSCSLQEWEDIEATYSVSHLSGSYGSSPDRMTGTLFPDTRYYRPKTVKISSGRQFDIHLQGLHELCSWGHREGMQKLRHLYQFFKRDMAVLQVERNDQAYMEPGASALYFGEDCVGANFLTSVDKNCMGCHCLHPDLPDMLLFNKCSSIDSLSFKSAASSFRSLNDDDTESMKSAVSATGSPVVSFTLVNQNDTTAASDTDKHIDIYSSNEYIRHLTFKIQQLEIESPMENATLSIDTDLVSSDTDTHTGNSEDMKNSLEGANYEKSEDPDSNAAKDSDITCAAEMVVSTSTLVGEDVMEEEEEDEEEGNRETPEHTDCSCDLDSEEETEARDRLQTLTAENVGRLDVESQTWSKKTEVEVEMKSVLAQSLKNDSVLENDSETISSYDLIRHNIENLVPIDLPEQESMLFPFLSDNGSPSSDSLGCGFGILHVMTKYASIKHLIYSILIGRSVVVVGTSDLEEEVRNIVNALKIFLTSYHRNHKSFIAWAKCLPSLYKMTDIKLIGVCRPERKPLDRFIPAVMKKLCTVFDVKQREVFCPSYQGYYLSLLDNRLRFYKMEEMLTTLIKSILVELSSKAFIYFHSFCIGPAGVGRQDYKFLQQQSSSFQRRVSNFMAKIGVHDSDIHIIEFLSENVKQQLIEEHFQSRTGVSYMPERPLTTLNNICCQMMKC
ncbi:guanine nucleotide exchange protein SMCR8-like isoform X1 [Crassostrea virginica]